MLLAFPVLAAVLYAFRATLFSPGVPDFRHDWWWPFGSDAIHAAFPDVLRVWNVAGLGAPRYEVVNHPALWVIHALAAALPSKAILLIGIVAAVSSVGAGVAVLARRLGARAPVACCAGIAAALGAPTFDKFVAGHWYYTIAIAALPWAIACAAGYRGKDLPRAIATGAIVALTALQPQIWVIASVVCLAIVVCGPDRRDAGTALDAFAMIAAGSVLMVPEIYGVFAAHSVASFPDVQTIPMWEANNSARLADAIVGLGYAPGYAERALAAVPWAIGLLWLIPLAAVYGFVARRNDRVVRVLGVAWLVALALVAGVKGPLALPLEYLYAHYLWASAFRELYHFAEPMWIFAALLAAVATERLRPSAADVLAAASAAGVLALWAPPGYAGTLRSWDFASRSAALVADAPAVPSRYLLTPSIQPIGPPDTDASGVDPDANLHGVWYPLDSMGQHGVVGAFMLMGERDPVRYAGWLRAADVNAVLPRPYLRSSAIAASPLAPAEKVRAARLFPAPRGLSGWRDAPRPFVELRPTLPAVRDPFAERFDDGFVLARETMVDPHDPDTVPAGRRSDPPVPRSAWNPATTWVRADYWWWLDPRAAFWPHAALTWSDEVLPVPRGYRTGYAHVVVFAGTLYAGGTPVHAKPGIAFWQPMRGAAGLRVRGGAAMVIEFANVRLPLRAVRTGAPSTGRSAAVPVAFDLDCLCASMRTRTRRTWIVLKQTYDDDWNVRLDRGHVLRHVLYAGYGNAWEVDAPPGSRASLTYGPAASWQAIVAASLAAWIALALGSAAALWRR